MSEALFEEIVLLEHENVVDPPLNLLSVIEVPLGLAVQSEIFTPPTSVIERESMIAALITEMA